MTAITFDDFNDIEYSRSFGYRLAYSWNMYEGKVRKWEYRYTLTIL